MRKRIIFLLTFLCFLLIQGSAYAANNYGSKQQYVMLTLEEVEDENKVWNVPINDSLNIEKVDIYYLYVLNESDNSFVDIEYKINKDWTSVEIFPKKAYERGKNHIINMKYLVESKDGIKTVKKVKMPFKIREKVKLVPFTGTVEHIFIHPLIAYPELAFDGEYNEEDMDDWFITVTEYNRMLDELYKNDFILVDINSVYEEYKKDGKTLIRRAELLVPEGKKPLILSIDDLNYYDYMRKHGIVQKLVLNENKELAAFAIDPKGKEIVTKDNDCVPILNEFVKKHPDFSLNGAKGTIALTGYEGILGYRTHFESENYKSERENVVKIIDKLKEDGWNFASHSYGHIDFSTRSYAKVVYDTDKWAKEVQSLIGETQVFIYPYGSSVLPTTKKFKYLQKAGFKIICPVGNTSYEWILNESSGVITDRRHVDGISLRWQGKDFTDLYDAEKIIDRTVRPVR